MKERGFSLVEGLLVVIILSIVGFAGYYATTKNNSTLGNAVPDSNADLQAQIPITPIPLDDSNSKIMLSQFEGLSLQYRLPTNWTSVEYLPLREAPANEFSLVLGDPSRLLGVTISLTIDTDTSYDDGTKYLKADRSINYKDSILYYHGYVGNSTGASKFELIRVGNCELKNCFLKINETSALSIHISGYENSVDLAVGFDNPLFPTIDSIIQSISVSTN